jgi:hypothetical protein
MRTDFFVLGGGEAASSSTVRRLLLHCQHTQKDKAGNTMVAVSPPNTAIGIGKGSVRNGRRRGWRESLRGAKRVPGRHGEGYLHCIALCTWTRLVRSGENSAAQEMCVLRAAC